MSRVDQALTIQANAEAAVAAAGITEVSVTCELEKVADLLFHGVAVVIQPPDLDFVTYTQTDAEWEIFVISGPRDDRLEAWKQIDAVIEALQVPLSLLTAKPANFQPDGNPPYAAYVLTFNGYSVLTDG